MRYVKNSSKGRLTFQLSMCRVTCTSFCELKNIKFASSKKVARGQLNQTFELLLKLNDIWEHAAIKQELSLRLNWAPYGVMFNNIKEVRLINEIIIP